MPSVHLHEVVAHLPQALAKVDGQLRAVWVDPTFATKTGLVLEKNQPFLDLFEPGGSREAICEALLNGAVYTGAAITCALKQVRIQTHPIAGGTLVVIEPDGLDDEVAFAQALQEIARAVGESFEVDHVCAAACVAMVRCAQVSRAEVYLKDAQGLRRVAVSDLADLAPPEVSSDAVLKHALATGQPQIGISRSRVDSEGAIFAALPLNAQRRSVGLLVLYKGQGASFSVREMDLWSAAAGQLAVAVENARLLREAQAALRVREEFMSIASHELKTPLTPLKMSLYTMEKRLAQGLPVELSSIIKSKRQVDRLAGLVNDLLDASRLELGKLALTAGPLDLGQLVAEVVDQFQSSFSERRFDVQLPNARLWVNGDRDRLEQVLVNLIENAHKYSPPDKPIELQLGATRDRIGLLVRDHGIGIPGADQAQVFQRFYRARNASARNFGGLGLGLFISQSIVKLHGGELSLASSEGHGTTFSVMLPRLSARELRKLPRRILVLEESHERSLQVEQALRSEGYDVHPVRDLPDALRKLAQAPIDLAVLSSARVKGQGDLFLETLRRLPMPQAVPLLFTGEALPGWASPSSALCTGPFAPQVLAEQVRALLGEAAATTPAPRPVPSPPVCVSPTPAAPPFPTP